MKSFASFLGGVLATLSPVLNAQIAATQCSSCHTAEVSNWIGSPHANTQVDVAGELASSHAGETPASVVQGEDCIACHSPTAVTCNGRMNESQALGFFFTTTNAVFSDNTLATNTALWPEVGCATCHFVPTNHGIIGNPVFFDSQSAQYEHMSTPNQLCGQCHGSLKFSDTDHRIFDAWAMSRHANNQADVAAELSRSRAGQSPEDVIYGPDAENCIACHSPTAVLASGGDEATALDYFFTSSNGLFDASTSCDSTNEWPGVGCTACHDPHAPQKFSYFNSSTLQYDAMTNSDQLCGQCHGNLRFPGTDHLTYNLIRGTGGVGVPEQQLMAEVACTDCHMHSSDVDGSNSRMFRGHSWAVTVSEPDGSTTMSCLACHTEADPAGAEFLIADWQAEFQALDATVSANVARMAAALQGVQNSGLQAALAEAQFNLAYAESDESGGFHNHGYLMALLNDANQKALSVPLLNVASANGNVIISWTGPGVLQSADSVQGPWHDVSGASNPCVVPANSPTLQRFYRLRP